MFVLSSLESSEVSMVDRSDSDYESITSGLSSFEVLLIVPVVTHSSYVSRDLLVVEDEVLRDSLSELEFAGENLSPGFDRPDIRNEVFAGSQFSRDSRSKGVEIFDGRFPVFAFCSFDSLGKVLLKSMSSVVTSFNFSEIALFNEGIQ